MIETTIQPWIVSIAIFVGTSAMVVVVLKKLFGQLDPRVELRLREVGGKSQFEAYCPPQTVSSNRALLRIANSALFNLFLPPKDEESMSAVRVMLSRAGIYTPGAEAFYYAARLAAIVSGPIVGLLLAMGGYLGFDVAMLWGTILGFFGLMLPGVWLKSRIRRRHFVLRNSLSDFLDLFVASVESGMSLQGMMVTVSDELSGLHPELASEFSMCNRQVQLGQSLEEATADLAERTGLDDLRSFATFVKQSSRFGATIGSALRELSAMLQAQRAMRAEELAQKASVKILIPTLLFIFPTVFVVLVAPAAIRIQETMCQPNGDETIQASVTK